MSLHLGKKVVLYSLSYRKLQVIWKCSFQYGLVLLHAICEIPLLESLQYLYLVILPDGARNQSKTDSAPILWSWTSYGHLSCQKKYNPRQTADAFWPLKIWYQQIKTELWLYVTVEYLIRNITRLFFSNRFTMRFSQTCRQYYLVLTDRGTCTK